MSKRRAQVKMYKTGTRAAACAEFARKKAQCRRRAWQKRTVLLSTAFLLAFTGASVWWLQREGTFEAVAESTSNSFWRQTAEAGFNVQQIYLHGREYADKQAIANALLAPQGVPILQLDLAQIKARLETIPEVRSAQVARVLPHDLHIVISERVPVAIWQFGGVQHLIDRDGIVLKDAKYNAARASLPVLVGEDAPRHTHGLLRILASQPDLQPQVVAAIRVGQRRWNLQLANSVTILLPEEGAGKAWQRFGQLVRDEGILTHAVRAIDLRLEDRIFVTPQDIKATPVALVTAKDA